MLRAVAASVAGEGSSQSQFSSVAFASLPAAASSTGLIYRISDIGNSLWISDGTLWRPVGGTALLACSGVSVADANDTVENTLATITVPANAMGANGAVEIWASFTVTSSANTKTARIRFGGAAGTIYQALAPTTSASLQMYARITNRNATNSQVSGSATSVVFGVSSNAIVTSSVDTTAAVTAVITAQKDAGAVAATDLCTLQDYLARIIVP